MVLFHKCTHVFVFFRGFVARFVVQLFVLFLVDTVTGYGLDPKYGIDVCLIVTYSIVCSVRFGFVIVMCQ